MADFNNIIFYKAQFDLSARRPGMDLLWELVLKIKEWIVPRWNTNAHIVPTDNRAWSRFKWGDCFDGTDRLVSFQSFRYAEDGPPETERWACRIIERRPPRGDYAPRSWMIEVGFQRMVKDSAKLSIVRSYRDRPGFIGPCQPEPKDAVPGLIKLLFADERLLCSSSGIPLSLAPHHLQIGDFPAFWRVVSHPERETPVIYLSPQQLSPESEQARPLLSPKQVSRVLGPNAIVYYADDLDFSLEMKEMCPHSGLGCYAGAVRIYAARPRFDEPGDGYRHRYIQAAYIDEVGESVVLAILRRALAQDVSFYSSMFRLEDCRYLREQANIARQLAVFRAESEQMLEACRNDMQDTMLAEMLRYEQEKLGLQRELETAQQERDELRRQLYRVSAQAESFRQAACIADEREAALSQVRAFPELPDTPDTIAAYFCKVFADRLRFTARGIGSLKECTTRPDVLWSALYAMCTTLYELYAKGCYAIDQEFDRRTVFRMVRGAGVMTRRDKALLQQYRDEYDGREISIEAHIASSESRESDPRFLRIYFCYDAVTQKLLVGSCGQHLKNYTTRKLH